MSSEGAYDTDELRALAVALEVLDPKDPDEWDGSASQFAASVARGREQLERRGLATFARDGAAVVNPADAAVLRAFLAPDAVIESWIVNGSAAGRREWYVGSEVTVVADPSATEGEEQELATIDTREVFSDVFAFVDVRGVDVGGGPVRIDPEALDDFAGRPANPPDAEQRAPRLLNVAASWERSPIPRELQLVDAGDGGLWIVTTVEQHDGTVGEASATAADVIELTPATRGEIVERILAVVMPAPPA